MLKEQKVQFFNSESSFGSQSSLASSRYFDLTNQILQETQTVFLTLNRQFLPTPELTNFDKIDYLHNRAKIISRDTIPDHLNYLKKISSPKQSLDVCYQCEKKLEIFIKDYQGLKRGQLMHKQFYNLYGRSLQNNVFFKKQNGAVYGLQINGMMQPDIESIAQVKSTRLKNVQDYKLTTRSVVPALKPTNDKQVMQLQQDISIMKKREIDLRRQYDYLLTTQKLNCQKRVNAFLRALNKKNNNGYSVQLQQNYKNESIRLGQQLTRGLKQKQQLLNNNRLLQKNIQQINTINRSLRQQLASYKKLEYSRISNEQDLNQSFQSQQNNIDDSLNIKKLQLQIKKLISQRDILRNQLSKQRQNILKSNNINKSDQSKQIHRLKHYLETKNKQNQQLHRQLDQSKVQLIQLKQQVKLLNKNISTSNKNTQQLKKTLENIDLTQSNTWTNNNNLNPNNLITFKNKAQNKTLQKQSSKLNSFQQYQGEGIQGYPYYQLLSKQFKIRFKRACLKNKQLLYKSNGLEIGVITQYTSPNIVKVLLHITNSSESDITGINVKAINPNQNKIQCDIEKVDRLLSNQQVKIPVTCTIKNYPIGPVVFALDYNADIKQDVRLLLPVHIFKCVNIEARTQQFNNATKLVIKTQRKICKDMGVLRQYLNSEDSSDIKVQIRHEHSNSLLYMNGRVNKDEIQIQYEHRSGEQKFTQYFIKTFKTLLQKQV